MGGKGSGRGLGVTHQNCGGKLTSIYIYSAKYQKKYTSKKLNSTLKACLKCNTIVKITVTQENLK